MFNVFTRYINEIEQYIDRSKIHLILYENSPHDCLHNVKIRKDPQKDNKSIETTINAYSKVYNLDHYTKHWKSTMMLVWKN